MELQPQTSMTRSGAPQRVPQCVSCTGLSGRPERTWRRYPGRWQSVKKTVFCSWQSMKQECESYASYASNTFKYHQIQILGWFHAGGSLPKVPWHTLSEWHDMTAAQDWFCSSGFCVLETCASYQDVPGITWVPLNELCLPLLQKPGSLIRACTALLIPTVGRYLLSSFQPLTKSRDLFEKVEHFVHAAKFDEFDVPNSHELFGFRMIPETHQRMQWH